MSVSDTDPGQSAAEPVDVAPVAPEAAPAVEAAPAPSLFPTVMPGGRRYETLMIVHPRYEGAALETLTKELIAIMTAHGAEHVNPTVMGRRTLAYRLAKQTEGVYVNFVYNAPTQSIAGIENDIGHQESVLRFLTTTEDR